MNRRIVPSMLIAVATTTVALSALASSHREAPFITTRPKVDGTDFYMFRSYEPGREAYLTLIANYIPLQDPDGGPNFFTMDPDALYEIHLDNNGDAIEDLTFQFRFNTTVKGLAVTAGSKSIPVPLSNIGPISAADSSALNVSQTYTLKVVSGSRRSSNAQAVTNSSTGSATFAKPFDNIGNKSIPNYAAYANSFIHTVAIPGCSTPAKVFVGQRKEGFVVNIGETFDLVNIQYPAEELAPGNGRGLERNGLANKNVTSLALEVPISCVKAANEAVVGGWTTASMRQATVLNPRPQSDKSVASVGASTTPTGSAVQGGAWVQVSRLSAPLVNEIVIGLPDKDRFNASQPRNDSQFADYVTNPSLPVLLQTLFGPAGVRAPNVYPRSDLVAAFLTGVTGLNKPTTVTASEMLRLNTGTAVTPAASQNDLGVIGGDNAGFPNGRRPIDDVVDIELRVAMGVLLTPFSGAQDPDPVSSVSRQLRYTDGARPNPADYLTAFPYLATPLPGSPSN